MSDKEKSLTKSSEALPAVPKKDMVLPVVGPMAKTIDELWRLANAFYKAPDMRPASLNTPEKIMAVMLHGRSAGLDEATSLRSIYVTNGMPNWYVNAAMGLVRRSGKLRQGKGIDTWLELDGEVTKLAPEDDKQLEKLVAYCRTHRIDEDVPVTHAFNVAQAKRAGLWMSKSREGKPTQWVLRPDRMLIASARREHLKDQYPEVLGNIEVGYRRESSDTEEYGEEYATTGRATILAAAPPEADDDPLLRSLPEPTPLENMSGSATGSGVIDVEEEGTMTLPPEEPPLADVDQPPPAPEGVEVYEPPSSVPWTCPANCRMEDIIRKIGHAPHCPEFPGLMPTEEP